MNKLAQNMQPTDVALDVAQSPAEVRAILMKRARLLVPVLKARAKQAEAMRRIPDETVQDLINGGFLRVSVPVQYGGYAGVEHDLVMDIAVEFGRGCPSTAWCYTIWQSHNLSISRMQAAVREEYYAPGPNVISSTARMVLSEDIKIVEGGLLINAHYKYSSGADHATWFIVLTRGMIGLLLKREEVEVIDDWHVLGLRGTGSNDIKLTNVFLPHERIWGLFDTSTANPPIWVRNKRFSERVDGMFMAYTALAPAIGAAQGAVEAFIEQYKGTKPRPMMEDVTAESTSMQTRLAQSAAEADAARLIMQADMRELLTCAAEGTPIAAIDRARFRRNQVYAAQLCVSSTNRLFEPIGGRGISNGSQVQRYYRDANAAAHHAGLPTDRLLENYGRLAFGLGPISDYLGNSLHPSLTPDMFDPGDPANIEHLSVAPAKEGGVLPTALCNAVNRSMVTGNPLLVTYWDTKGAPQTSWRGSTHVHADGTLAIWIRSRQGGLQGAIGANPHMMLAYRHPHTGDFITFEGSARLANSDEENARIYTESPPMERMADLERRGVGVIVKLRRVVGVLDQRKVTIDL